jgi:hypothetical protein
MAEDKKSFVLYADLIHTVRKMPKEKAGELFMTILSYVNDENPVVEDVLVDLVFEPIKRQMKRDLKKYEDKKKKFSEAGKASAEAKRIAKETQQNSTSLNDVEKRSTFSTVTDTVNDTVTVTVTDNVIKIQEEQNFILPVCDEKKSEGGVSEEILVEAESFTEINPQPEKEKSSAKKEKQFDFRRELTASGYTPSLVDEWLKIRAKKKAINSELAFKTFQTEVMKTGKPPNEVLEIVVKKQWKGLEAEWIKNLETNKNQINGNNFKSPTKGQNDQIWRTIGKAEDAGAIRVIS